MKLLRPLVFIGILLALVIGALRLTVVSWWRIPADAPYLSAPLAPSLAAGDLVLTWRGTAPKFGDLVICEHPTEPGEIVIGRILGEARDTLKVEPSSVTVNGTRSRSYSGCTEREITVEDARTGIEYPARCAGEEFSSGWYLTARVPSSRSAYVETVVPDEHVYLISDNRGFAYDSRDYGPVPAANCREVIFFRLWGADGFSDVERRFTYIR